MQKERSVLKGEDRVSICSDHRGLRRGDMEMKSFPEMAAVWSCQGTELQKEEPNVQRGRRSVRQMGLHRGMRYLPEFVTDIQQL